MKIWCQLQREYPDATLFKYLDDLNGTVDNPETEIDVSGPRAQGLPGAYVFKSDTGNSYSPQKAALVFAIIKR